MGERIPDEYFQAVQKASLPGVWSKGVALARENAVILDSHAHGEWKLRVKVAGRPVSPKVTLWPEDEDQHCDCGDRREYCLHIAAAVVALKNGIKQADASGDRVEYRFVREDGALKLERWLVRAEKSEQITGSLVSLAGGIGSGRIAAPNIPATKEDFAIDQLLAPAGRAMVDAVIPWREVAPLFKSLKECPAVFLDGQPVAVATVPVRIRAELIDESGGYRLKQVADPELREAFQNGIVFHAGALKPYEAPDLTVAQKQLLKGEGTHFARKDIAHLVSHILPTLETQIPIEIKAARLPKAVRLAPRLELRLEQEAAETLGVTASIVYGDPVIAELAQGQLVSRSSESFPIRDLAAEHALARALQSELHLPIGERKKVGGIAAIDFAEKVRDFTRRQGNARVHGGGAAAFTVGEGLKPKLKIAADGRSAEVDFGGADPARVWQAWQAGESLVPLLGGGWAPLPKDWLARFGDRVLALLDARKHAGDQKLAPYRLPELAALCEETGSDTPLSLKTLGDRLKNFERIPEAPLPKDLRAELRGYQRRGINWLGFLESLGMGALLADDMGLGKTLQALAAARGKTLVIAPTSVLEAWRNQARQFRPALQTALYYGGDRRLDENAELIVTSYGVLRLDQELLAAREWDTVILDEAQTIKNAESQVARAAHRLRGRFKIALSGTPVENHLSDLWSQFQFLNPGLLGSREDFQERFSAPIGRGEPGAAERLRKLIRPFLLRRLKRDVATELPARTETVLHCELSETERSTYDAIMVATRGEALRALDSGEGVFAALEALLRLRQAACHPALVPGQTAATSAKLELLVETMKESLDNGHRALIFSQWTSFLDLIEKRFGDETISYSRLDGSTRDRGALVDAFQRDDGPSCMLISLKAGGVGLTLTAADHVFILDPWWNPAAENQAADRAHRIGQENPVFIHRLVARGTVEDRILELQAKKLALAGAVLEGAGEAVSLTRDDLLSLFQ